MMKRSQIYLPASQWRRLSALSLQVHDSVSGLIRSAIDQVYGEPRRLEFSAALRGVTGLWGRRSDLPSTRDYVRGLRRGTRLRRLRGDA